MTNFKGCLKSCGLQGIDGYIVEVETDVANGFPGFEKVGLPEDKTK